MNLRLQFIRRAVSTVAGRRITAPLAGSTANSVDYMRV
jgi:hypothetical protein